MVLLQAAKIKNKCSIALSLADKTIGGLIYVMDTHYREMGSLPLHSKSMVIMFPWTVRGETIPLPVYTPQVDFLMIGWRGPVNIVCPL